VEVVVKEEKELKAYRQMSVISFNSRQQGSFSSLGNWVWSGAFRLFRMQWRAPTRKSETSKQWQQPEPAPLISLTDVNTCPRYKRRPGTIVVANTAVTAQRFGARLGYSSCSSFNQVDVICSILRSFQLPIQGGRIALKPPGGVHGRRVVDRCEQIAQCCDGPLECCISLRWMTACRWNSRDFREHDCPCMPLFRRRVHNEYLTVQKITWIQEQQENHRHHHNDHHHKQEKSLDSFNLTISFFL
jgi:hypothetical protein